MKLGYGPMLALVLALSAAAAPVEKKGETSKLTAERLEKAWGELIQNDDAGCRQALDTMQSMTQAPDLVVPFLKERLKAAGTTNRGPIAKAILDLDSNDFNTRENAMKLLQQIGAPALPLLDKKLQEKEISLELQNRLKQLIQMAEGSEGKGLSADDLRAIRSIAVLQEIGTADAQAILAVLSKGGDASPVTGAAQRALADCKRRAGGASR